MLTDRCGYQSGDLLADTVQIFEFPKVPYCADVFQIVISQAVETRLLRRAELVSILT